MMSTTGTTGSSKREQYMQKFQKFKEEKGKLKKYNGLQISSSSTLKPQNALLKTKSNFKNNFTTVKTIPKPSIDIVKSKENEKPVTKTPVAKVSNPQKQFSTNSKKISNIEHVTKTFPITKSCSATEPRKNLSRPSSLHVRKSLGQYDRPRRLDQSQESKGNKPQNKHEIGRKSTGTIVKAKVVHNNNSRKSFSSVNINSNKLTTSSNVNRKPSIQPKSRRYSDTLKEQKKAKPASILKRKSCFASIDVVNEGIMGKTPDQGRTVRFISPDLEGLNCSNNKYRKTPKRGLEKAERLSTPSLSVKRSASNRQFTPRQSAVKKPRHCEEQAAMRSKLDAWLKSKGKTPSKFRHLMCFHEQGVDREPENNTDSCMKRCLTVEELTEQKATIDREDSIKVNLVDQFRDAALEELDSMLEECSTLYQAGCPREDILRWLDSIEHNVQISKTCAKFYICKAQVLKSSENLEEVLKVYETAVINGAQPSHELAFALTGIVKDVCQEREKKARRRSTTDIQKDNIFESSAIKYTVRQVDKKRRRSASEAKSSCVVITPVRRSTRRSISCLPSSLQDKTPTYKSLEDVSERDRKKSLFFPNEALNDVFNDQS